VTAVATDSDGAAVTSTPATVTVVASAPIQPSSGTDSLGSGPWKLQFGASFDHATLDHYQMEIYASAGALPVVSKNIGKPAVDSQGNCTVDVNTLLLALPLGSYSVVVKSVASAGSGASTPYWFTR
jgi:hypothetical protein